VNSEEMESRKRALIAEVYAAFEGVSREGGVSWSQSEAELMYRTPEEHAEAAKRDTDACWQDLVDSSWRDDQGVGGFNFLDEISCRYYLPAVLVRDLRHGESTLEFHLNCPPPGAKRRDVQIKQWSRLNDRQRRCIAEFVQFAIARARFAGDGFSLRSFQQAWDNYWKDYAVKENG
jgi:hypothetical protein